jgi:predicted 2-oxoglutarate/Fe(II)-dependent dioxygenase YbiX
MQPVLLLEDVFQNAECDALISLAETLGFESAKIDGAMNGPRGFKTEDGRDNARSALEDVTVAGLIWERIQSRVPPLEGWKASGINERLRFYRYEPGQRFAYHQDGFYQRSPDERSFLTILLYLNDNFKGGETAFRDPEESFQPQTGSALIFPHNRWHEGRPILSGTKYVLRTDVLFKATFKQ